MKKRKRSPQEKKSLSYVKDRRNGVAEMRSIAHRAISKRKTLANQAFRSASRGVLTKELRAHTDLADIDEHVARTGSMSWRKIPDMPLASYLESKIESRPSRGKSSKASRSATLSTARRKARDRRGW
jgi:hypothetical protein